MLIGPPSHSSASALCRPGARPGARPAVRVEPPPHDSSDAAASAGGHRRSCPGCDCAVCSIEDPTICPRSCPTGAQDRAQLERRMEALPTEEACAPGLKTSRLPVGVGGGGASGGGGGGDGGGRPPWARPGGPGDGGEVN